MDDIEEVDWSDYRSYLGSPRDGILRERREYARGRNLADCGRICGSPGKSVGSN